VRFSFDGGLGDAYKYFFLILLIPVGLGIVIALAMYLAQVDDGSLYAIVIAAAFLSFYLIVPYV